MVWETKLKSTGNKDAILAGKDVVKAQSDSNAEEGGAFKVQLKSTGQKDATKDAKPKTEVKAKTEEASTAAPAPAPKRRTSWMAANELKPVGNKETGAPEKAAPAKDVKEKKEPKKEPEEPNEGGAFKVQLKSTGNKDAVLAGKDVKTKAEEDNNGGALKRRTSWKAANELKKTEIKAPEIAETKTEWAAPSALKSTGNKEAVLEGKDVKAKTEEDNNGGAPKRRTSWMAANELKKTEIKAPEIAETKTEWAAPSALKSTGNKDAVLEGKDIKTGEVAKTEFVAPALKKAETKAPDIAETKTEWAAPSALKSTGNKDAVLEGKDIKTGEVVATKTEWADKSLKKAEIKAPEIAETKTEWVAPSALKSTGNKEAVLEGKDIKTGEVAKTEFVAPALKKAEIKAPEIAETKTEWAAPSALKSTGNKEAVLEGKDIKTGEVAKTEFVAPTLKKAEIKAPEIAETKTEWAAPSALKSTGNKDAVLEGKDIKTGEVAKTEFVAPALRKAETKAPEVAETKTEWAAPSALKSTGNKDAVLEGKDIKTGDVAKTEFVAPALKKAEIKAPEVAETKTEWAAPSALKSTGNKEAMLAGADVKTEESKAPKPRRASWMAANELKPVEEKKDAKDVKAEQSGGEDSKPKKAWNLKSTGGKDAKQENGNVKARRASFHPNQLKPTEKKDTVAPLASGEETKKPGTVKPRRQTFMSLGELKKTGNINSILDGKDVQKAGAETSESANPWANTQLKSTGSNLST